MTVERPCVCPTAKTSSNGLNFTLIVCILDAKNRVDAVDPAPDDRAALGVRIVCFKYVKSVGFMKASFNTSTDRPTAIAIRPVSETSRDIAGWEVV
jgi:hypothetical protein